MFLSLNWLKDYVKIPGSLTAADLGLRLTMHTVEIDGVEEQRERFAKVVVGKILEIKKHPNADRLQLTRVDVGEEELLIVCGAPNIEVGQLVPVALAGAKLPNGLEIKVSEVRGETSNGMLCAEDELGLGSDHDGIMVLEKRAKIGQNFGGYLNLKDTVYEVDNKSITHRPDLWGHYGVAREIACFLDAKFDTKLQNKTIDDFEIKAKDAIKVKIDDHKLCPRYMAIGVEGVTIEPSPNWMQERLIAVGVRPINNIVDVTNYVMLELGQPLHAFDQSKLASIKVRSARKGERIETLDGEKRELDETMLLITDNDEPVAVAGVMGGANSEISDDTTRIIIESANFDAISVRKTAQKLGLRTEASRRFEKSLDPNLTEIALVRAVELIKKICKKAIINTQVADVKKFEDRGVTINLDFMWLDERMGKKLSREEVIDTLEKLGFSTNSKEDSLEVVVPTWRAGKDVSASEDLLEEVSRIHGFDNIEPVMPRVEMIAPNKVAEIELEREVRNVLVSAGLNEVYNYSFVGEEQLKKLGINHDLHIKLANPISRNHTMVRQNLAPNLIENIKTNQARFDDIRLFEIGSIYTDQLEGEAKSDKGSGKLPYEERRVGIVIAGGMKEDSPFLRAKGVIEFLLDYYGLETEYKISEALPAWSSGTGAEILASTNSVGFVSVLDSQIAKRLGIKKETAIAEINLKGLLQTVEGRGVKQFREYEKYPALTRDLAFVVGDNILYNDIKKEILSFHDYIDSVELFDVYTGGKLEKKEKSLAFHVVYQADKTLTSEEVDGIQKNLIEVLEEKFEAKIRDF